MTRTNRHMPQRTKGDSTSRANEKQRISDVSKAITKLLRHGAQNEKVPITSQGWVKLDDLLAWRGLSDTKRFNPTVTLEEIFEVVEHDGKFGKGRFGLKLVNEISHDEEEGVPQVDRKATVEMTDMAKNLNLHITSANETPTKNNPQTINTISRFRSNPSDQSSYLIRATQGHSIKTIESEGLLTSILFDDPSNIPGTVVHGTFYGSWNLILSSGGLKPMGRNMVHFATGPALSEIMPEGDRGLSKSLKHKKDVDEMLGKNKVVSGMRWDAQILIYIDMRRCLEDVQAKGLDMKWFKSENGVILTEGLVSADDDRNLDDAASGRKQRQGKSARIPDKLVPMEYWITVVEVKEGLGVLWRYGDGVIQELPDQLRNKPLPYGKQGRRIGGQGQRSKMEPRLRVERDGVGVEEEDA